jgi:phosphoglucosamine mutase
MKKLFGTDGMRGEAGVFPLDERTIKIAGHSLAQQFKERTGRVPRFVTGRDTRESGEWIERAFHAGAVAGGAECYSAGVIPTPGVAFITGFRDLDAGIVISASHNPFEDNGIKVFLPSGAKLDEATERQIEKDIYESRERETVPESSSFNEDFVEVLQGVYTMHLEGEIDDVSPNTLIIAPEHEDAGTATAKLKIVIDCANGATSAYAAQLFSSDKIAVIAIHCEPNGRNINLACGSTHIQDLQKKVVETGADLGVAFDGDADRALFVDRHGELVDGDAVMWVMAQYLQDKGELKGDIVVATVMSNIGLEAALKTRGIALARTAVGDKYVLEELLKSGAALGGEQSGHIIFPYHSLVGDGMLTALFLLKVIQEKGKTLTELMAGFTRYPQILLNVKVREKLPFDEVPEIHAAAEKLENELGESGRLLLRYSGTENLARVMIEGKEQETIDRQAAELAEVIRKSLG